MPDESYLLLGEDVLPLEPARDRRLGSWRVGEIPGGTRSTREASGSASSLDDALSAANATPLDDRVPALAVASNASPAQLMSKLSAPPTDLAIPVARAWLRGLELAFSGHVNRWGYVPAAVRAADADTEVDVFVTFLDAEQLAVMDATEPNYERVMVRHPNGEGLVRLESGEELKACALYRTRHGVLDLDVADNGGLVSQRELRRRIKDRLVESEGLGLDVLEIQRFADSDWSDVVLADFPQISAANMIVPDELEPYVADEHRTHGKTGSSLRSHMSS